MKVPLDSDRPKRRPLWLCTKDVVTTVSKVGSVVLGAGGYFIPVEPGSTRVATLGRWVMQAAHAVKEILT